MHTPCWNPRHVKSRNSHKWWNKTRMLGNNSFNKARSASWCSLSTIKYQAMKCSMSSLLKSRNSQAVIQHRHRHSTQQGQPHVILVLPTLRTRFMTWNNNCGTSSLIFKDLAILKELSAHFPNPSCSSNMTTQCNKHSSHTPKSLQPSVYTNTRYYYTSYYYNVEYWIIYLKRLASRSHSNKHKISPSLTGPLTFRTMLRPVPVPASASMNSTRTWVTLPVFPVRPRTLLTLASLTGWSCVKIINEQSVR